MRIINYITLFAFSEQVMAEVFDRIRRENEVELIKVNIVVDRAGLNIRKEELRDLVCRQTICIPGVTNKKPS